jgi:hypothetical protein
MTTNTNGTPQAKEMATRSFSENGQYGSGTVYEDGSPKEGGTNAVGDRTISASPPSGGKDGDIWYQIA